MGRELEAAHLVSELVSIRFVEELYPADVVLGRVGMGNLLTERDLDGKHLVCLTQLSAHLIRTASDREAGMSEVYHWTRRSKEGCHSCHCG